MQLRQAANNGGRGDLKQWFSPPATISNEIKSLGQNSKQKRIFQHQMEAATSSGFANIFRIQFQQIFLRIKDMLISLLETV